MEVNTVFQEAQNNFLDQDSAHNFSPASSHPKVGVGGKRKGHQFPELFTAGGKKRKLGGGPVQAKNALVTLNEYKPGLEYVLVDQRGPVHQPVFVIRVTINGSQFVGEGGSKKLAKLAAAEAALKSLIQFKNPLEAQVAMGMGMSPYQNAMDFTKDTEIGEELNQFDQHSYSDTSYEELKHSNINVSSGSEKLTPKSKVPQAGQNPVMTLNEMRPGLSFECSESGSSPATKRFTMKVVIEEKEFEGSGASKKLAKQAAAKAALTQLYNMNFTHLTPDNSMSGSAPKKVAGTDLLVTEFSMDQAVADNIGKLILAKYDELMVGLPQHSRRKVIAGIVMTKDKDMHDMEVISVSTGTKCVNGEYMSVSGTALNDCHAEIISRRCLMEFLYSQLEQVANANGEVGDTILLKSENGGYKLKENLRFHLYINTAPCGDARIFSPHEALAGEEADRHPNRNSRGQLRTKIESGEGTIPVKSNDGIQTWDGVMQGARLLTMSCSDKVCRWNVLGVQGSLLSYYLHPVYLHSVVLGSLFHPTHMYRALAGRIQSVLPSLPENYSLHTPRLNLLSSAEVRQPGKAPNYSVSWTKGRQEVEVVDAMKGKGQENGKSSRLCKVSMFKRWLELGKCNELSKIEDLSNPLPSIYNEAKLGSKKFQEVKRLLYKAFKDAELGHWVKKPMEQDDFEVK